MKSGYCTNIHSGASLQSVIENLQKFSVPIRNTFCPTEPMGIGLWLSEPAVREALTDDNWKRLDEVLTNNSLVANSFNAFPYFDFHQPTVKHAVYLPNWADPRRLQYTLQVAELQGRLLRERTIGSLSTLPIGWPGDTNREKVLTMSAGNIIKCALGLSELTQRLGTKLRLAIEPEPGCFLDSSSKLVDFFQRFLFSGEQGPIVREYVGVCHDICHSAVMFEDQAEALDNYRAAGIEIAKIQVSSAITCVCSDADVADTQLKALADFVEPRYLHQTTTQNGERQLTFFEDLPRAIAEATAFSFPCTLRTHFHVPIHLEKIGALGTTQADVLKCLAWVAANREATLNTDIEVETYAWDVAPEPARSGTLVESVVAELRFLDSIDGKISAL